MKNLFLLIGLFSLSSLLIQAQDLELNQGESVIIDANGKIVPSATSKVSSDITTGNNKNSDIIYNEDGTIKIPGYIPTGNPEIDKENYRKAKYLLYQNNPEEYNRLVKKVSDKYNIINVSFEEYSSLPVNKQDYMLEHPEKYFIEGINY